MGKAVGIIRAFDLFVTQGFLGALQVVPGMRFIMASGPSRSTFIRTLLFKIFPGLFLIVFPIRCLETVALSEPISILVRGVDDGIKTSKQQDYEEAVTNAKCQAIERAGIRVESITKVVDFKLKSEIIESKADAALLPGYSIMDMGYQTDGSYQVVLSGKIEKRPGKPRVTLDVLINLGKREEVKGDRYVKWHEYRLAESSYIGGIEHFKEVLDKFPGSDEALEIEKGGVIKRLENKIGATTWEGPFFRYLNGVVKDTRTGLMWSWRDNGKNINWYESKKYCANYRAGGYRDWRMPTMDELKGIYVSKKRSRRRITNLISMSGCCAWSAESRGAYENRPLASCFDFCSGNVNLGYQAESEGRRVLPVRGKN